MSIHGAWAEEVGACLTSNTVFKSLRASQDTLFKENLTIGE